MSTSTNTVVTRIKVGLRPSGVGFGSSNDDIHVPTGGGVYVISTSTNSVVTTITTQSTGGSGGIAFAPSNNDIYVGYTAEGSDRAVSVISTPPTA